MGSLRDSGAEGAAELGARFVRFADNECGRYSPTYDRLARRIATEPALLSIASTTRPGQQVPNIFFAAAKYVLGAAIATLDDDAFVDACMLHAEELRELCATRLVQTNEVRRCTYLMPAFVEIARRARRPLVLIEVGASAGLLLAFDRYRYVYTGERGRRSAGDAGARLRLDAERHGDLDPPIEVDDVTIAGRVGIDLNPIDPADPDALRWLEALVWPDHPDRLERLRVALEVLAADPIRVVAGNALDVLPGLVGSVPADSLPVVITNMVLAHFPADAIEIFLAELNDLAAGRAGDLVWLTCEGGSSAGRNLRITDFRTVPAASEHLAAVQAHGAWLRWKLA